MLSEDVPQTLLRLDGWVNRLAARFPQPMQARFPDADFEWRHPEETAEAVVVSKSVRLVSALAGSWRLAQAGQTAEAASLCRLLGDFASEIWFVGDGILSGEPNRAQRRFVEQHFAPLARDMETYLSQERAYWVSRREIHKVLTRTADSAGYDGQRHTDTSRFIEYALNSYVHGAYGSAMELYHGGAGRFFVLGFDGGRVKEATIRFVASKATEVCLAVEFASLTLGALALRDEIASYVRSIDPNL